MLSETFIVERSGACLDHPLVMNYVDWIRLVSWFKEEGILLPFKVPPWVLR